MAHNSHCDACGPSQANHSSLWLTNSSDVLALKLGFVRNAPWLRFLAAFGELLVGALGRVAFFLGKTLGFLTFGEDLARAHSDRSRIIWREAKARGIPMRQLFLFGQPSDMFEIFVNGKRHFFQSIPIPPVLEKTESLDMDDKVAFKRTLRALGLPVPKSYSVRSYHRAKQILSELGTVCVKPQSGSNGRHTYPFVKTDTDLEPALRSATQICILASIEEHLEGNLCRATCVDGVLVGFLESHYPTVTGDGISTIAELVYNANAEKPEGVADITLTRSHEGYIRRRGYALSDVLPEGVSLPLTYRAGFGQGGRNREHGRAIHPSFIPLIEEAARAAHLAVVGFDIIIPDPQKPADTQRWGFIEANSLPWIDLHQGALYGEHVNLAPPVWDLWKKY